MIDDDQLVARLSERFEDVDLTGLDAHDVCALTGSWVDAMLFARVLWPRFIERDGMVFMEGAFDGPEGLGRLDQVLAYCDGDPAIVERTVNVFEVRDLFGAEEPAPEEELSVAEQIAEMWAARLASTFHDRDFVVAVLAPDDEEDEPLEITFYQAEDGETDELGERRPIVLEASPSKPAGAPPRAPRPPRPEEAAGA